MLKQLPDSSTARRNLQIIHSYPDSGFLFDSWLSSYHTYENHAIECHWHEDLEFHLVLKGQLTLNLNGTILELHAGDCVFVNGNTLHMSHQTESQPPATRLITSFHPRMFSQILQDSVYESCFETILQHTNGFLIDQTILSGAKIADLLRELSGFSRKDPGYELLCLSRLSALWYETMQYMKETQDMHDTPDLQKNNSIAAKKMLAYIYTHYDQPIKVEDLLNYSNLSRSECFRCFKRYIGTTPVEYINEYRLSQSTFLLTNTDMDIMEVCLACGFSSASYYGKLFKKRYGITPLAYRKASGS